MTCYTCGRDYDAPRKDADWSAWANLHHAPDSTPDKCPDCVAHIAALRSNEERRRS